MRRWQFSLAVFMAAILAIGLGLGALRSGSELLSGCIYLLFLGTLCLALVGALCRRDEARVFWIGFLVFGCGYYWNVYSAASSQVDGTGWILSGYLAVPQPEPTLPPTMLLNYLATTSEVSVSVGDTVMAPYGGAYYPAKVSKIDSSSTLIHVVWSDGTPGTVDPTQLQFQSSTTPKPGEAVMAQWQGAYYPATVQKIDKQATDVIHVTWDDGTTAIVGRGQLQQVMPPYWQTTGHSLLGMLVALVGGVLSRFLFTASRRPSRAGEA